jgi:hypothetical protein
MKQGGKNSNDHDRRAQSRDKGKYSSGITGNAEFTGRF